MKVAKSLFRGCFRVYLGDPVLTMRHVGSGRVPMAKCLLRRLNAYTIILVTKRLIWDEAKREAYYEWTES